MKSALHFFTQDIADKALAFQTRHALKSGGHHIESKMRLIRFLPPHGRVGRMRLRLIDKLQYLWRKSRIKLRTYRVCTGCLGHARPLLWLAIAANECNIMP